MIAEHLPECSTYDCNTHTCTYNHNWHIWIRGEASNIITNQSLSLSRLRSARQSHYGSHTRRFKRGYQLHHGFDMQVDAESRTLAFLSVSFDHFDLLPLLYSNGLCLSSGLYTIGIIGHLLSLCLPHFLETQLRRIQEYRK